MLFFNFTIKMPWSFHFMEMFMTIKMAQVSLGHNYKQYYYDILINIQYCFVDKCTLCDIRQKIMLFTFENKLSVWDINNFSVMVRVDIVVEYPYLSTRLFSDHLYTSKLSMTLFKFNINKLTNVPKIPINTVSST